MSHHIGAPPDTTPHQTRDARLRPTWAHVVTAYLIGSALALIGSALYGAMNDRTRTVVIDASAECVSMAHAAEMSHIARDRADQYTNDILRRSTALYGAILSGSALDVDTARQDWNAAIMLHTGASNQATQHRADMRAYLTHCYPAGE